MKTNRRRIIIISIILLSIALLLLLAGRSGLFGRGPTFTSTPTTVTIRDGADFMFPERIEGLDRPIAFAFAPGRRIFITERTGRIRVFENGRLREEPLATVDVPDLSGYHETGLLGIAIDPNFVDQPYVYVYHSYEDNGNLLNRVIRYRYGANNNPEAEVLLDRIPGGRIHNGGILKFGPDGNLYVSTGDSNNRSLAQNLDSNAGKILRMTPGGDIPDGNPFENSPVYSYGHRNVFGLAFHPETGELYATENGPNRDDEVNKILAGENYGWPNVTGVSSDDRFVDPIITYTPNIAPTQAIFYTGNVFRDIKNQLVFGAYNTNEIHALELAGEDNTEVAEDRVIFRSGSPIIGVAEAPDGTIYITDGNSIRRIQTLRISRFVN